MVVAAIFSTTLFTSPAVTPSNTSVVRASSDNLAATSTGCGLKIHGIGVIYLCLTLIFL